MEKLDPKIQQELNQSPESGSSGRQKVRVFLEGREVPCISCSMSFEPNQPAVAMIELVPLSVIKFIRPRTQVHVYVQDTYAFGDRDFYLAFEGEVLGRSHVKRHDGRAFRITAFDYTNYWDDAKAMIMNPNFLAGKAATGVAFGEPPPQQTAKAAAGAVLNSAATPNSPIIDILTRHTDGQGNIDLIKGIADVCRRLSSTNEFYRAAYERLRILDRIMVYPSGRLGQFLQKLKMEEFLQTFMGMHGGMFSLRQLLMSIMALVFHENITVPFPSFIPVKRGQGRSGFTISQFLFMPDCYTLPPPRCNVIFPNQQIAFTYDEDFRAAPTRYGFRASFPLLTGNESTQITYPIMYFPKSFARYMYKGFNPTGVNLTITESDLGSSLGPANVIESRDGRTYAEIFYGVKSQDQVVGTSFQPILRESDYLSNEEALRGIYYEDDVLVPAYSTLVRGGSLKLDAQNRVTGQENDGVENTSRNDFMFEVGQYLFFKKRYSSRAVSADVMFSPFLTPGFTCLFVDDSDAGQSFIAKLVGVTHTLTHTGFTTTLKLAYGRDFDEIDFMTGGMGDPPLPRWFDPSLFGVTATSNSDVALFKQETTYLSKQQTPTKESLIDKAEVDLRNSLRAPTIYPNLGKFYLDLLGCPSITEVGTAPKSKNAAPPKVLVSTRGAVTDIVNQYNLKKVEKDPLALESYVRSYVRRPVVRMSEAFDFLGAEPAPIPTTDSPSKKIPDEFAWFVSIKDSKRTGLPGRFDGVDAAGRAYSDRLVLKIRRDVVNSYVEQLLKKRGFRG